MNALNSVSVNQFARRCIASCEKLLARITKARNAIQAEFRGTLQANDRLVQLALNEAEALAWQTDYPHLLFPTLAQEKIQALAVWNQRQKRMRRSPSQFALTA